MKKILRNVLVILILSFILGGCGSRKYEDVYSNVLMEKTLEYKSIYRTKVIFAGNLHLSRNLVRKSERLALNVNGNIKFEFDSKIERENVKKLLFYYAKYDLEFLKKVKYKEFSHKAYLTGPVIGTYSYSYIVNLPSKLLRNIILNFKLAKYNPDLAGLPGWNLQDNFKKKKTLKAIIFSFRDIFEAIFGFILAILYFVTSFLFFLLTPITSILDILPCIKEFFVTSLHAVVGIINAIMFLFKSGSEIFLNRK